MNSVRAIQRNVQMLGSSEVQTKTSKMATNEVTCSNKGTLSESVDVTLKITDNKPELTSHHSLEDTEEENLETLKKRKGK